MASVATCVSRQVRCLLPVLLVVVAVVAPHGTAKAEIEDVNAVATSVLTASWDLTLDAADAYIRQNDLLPEQTDYFFDEAERVDREADIVAATAEARIAKIDEVLEAIGDRPPIAYSEHSLIGETRSNLIVERADQANRAAIATIMSDRAEIIIATLSSDEWVWSRMWTRSVPAPSVSNFTNALPAALSILASIAHSPVVWFNEIDIHKHLNDQTALSIFGLFIAVVIGWFVRGFVLEQFGRDPNIHDPTYSRRFAAALAEGFAGGIVPALVVGVFLYDLGRNDTPITGAFADTLRGVGYAVTFLFLAFALIKSALSPQQTAWRITLLTPDSARRLSWRCRLLAIVIAIDLFLSIAGNPASVSASLRTFETFGSIVIEGLILLSLVSGKLWQREVPPDEDGAAHEKERRLSKRLWLWARRATVVIVIVGIAGSVIGYLDLGSFLIKSMLSTAIVAAVLFLSREILRESIAMMTRSKLLRERLGASHRTRRTMKFWLRAVLDPMLAILMVYVLANIWGVPFDRLAMWTGQALQGFQVGNVQISLLDIAAGIGTFIVTIVVTRLVQTILQDHILPESGWDEGTQLSVLSVMSYVGFTLAAVLGIAVIGVDMTTIGLIAGGLSIGIGLGLQGIVNNFISGIILLIERPVKVGDWVIVGAHEGFVKRVSIRATEIETWRRANVIIPNAELLNTSVTNWTHHDRMGRMEIKVRVPRGADVDLVQEIMLDCGKSHPSVVSWPEPSALFMDFGENGLDFELRCFTADNLWVYFIASDIRFAINRRLREEGIEIVLPQRVIHMADETRPTAPPNDADPV